MFLVHYLCSTCPCLSHRGKFWPGDNPGFSSVQTALRDFKGFFGRMQGKGCNTVRKVVTFQEMQSFREEKKKIQEGSANIFLFCRFQGHDESL